MEVPFLPLLDRQSSLQEVSELLDNLEKHAIDAAPWPAFGYKPRVAFSVAHSSDCFLVKFYVQENAIRAVFRKTNDPVYKDSCVELFIAFNGEEAYYNLEFNSLGTCLMGFGNGKKDRQVFSESIIREIKRSAQLNVRESKRGATVVHWELTLLIPVDVFCCHDFATLDGQNCKVNFFKCGDDLPNPHYLTWSTVTAEEPNFHLPEYFGEMQFQ
ncbi:carbohydrate-binding family 9-like protein [Rufibacter ruber]|uniref:carbohydrate-binding family 9-like protein n=1 Tax=Rufibacter ruber TaxID=1783499 RepID=UPI00137A5B03|nr:carbohydrate-binding family 9-like protein [Rufibacter ruber]